MEITIVDAPAHNRFEGYADSTLVGFLNYIRSGSVVSLTHAETLDGFGGQGVASAITQFALDSIRKEGDTAVRPSCPFVAGYITRNPDYADLLDR